ncbi:ornithine cyclodeaminase family protein [candidate division KSB1 bacterium]
MVQVFTLKEIKDVLKNINTVELIEEGFAAYSEGKVIVPPVGEMILDDENGEVHIKYGYIKGGDYYVIKIASGFYDNYKLGLPTTNGMMLVFSQKTGEPVSFLLDEGYLTEVRTAAAGAVAAKYLAPEKIKRIGIFGAGTQGRMQLEYLLPVIGCRDVVVWGLNEEELDKYEKDMARFKLNIQTTLDAEEAARNSDLIVTATPSKKPLIKAEWISPGTHITAMGSDTPEKNELDPEIVKKADVVVADSIEQCLLRGEIYQALKRDLINKDKLTELGNVISGRSPGRTSGDQITIADLTGVAVQDIQISKAVYEALK